MKMVDFEHTLDDAYSRRARELAAISARTDLSDAQKQSLAMQSGMSQRSGAGGGVGTVYNPATETYVKGGGGGTAAPVQVEATKKVETKPTATVNPAVQKFLQKKDAFALKTPVQKTAGLTIEQARKAGLIDSSSVIQQQASQKQVVPSSGMTAAQAMQMGLLNPITQQQQSVSSTSISSEQANYIISNYQSQQAQSTLQKESIKESLKATVQLQNYASTLQTKVNSGEISFDRANSALLLRKNELERGITKKVAAVASALPKYQQVQQQEYVVPKKETLQDKRIMQVGSGNYKPDVVKDLIGGFSFGASSAISAVGFTQNLSTYGLRSLAAPALAKVSMANGQPMTEKEFMQALFMEYKTGFSQRYYETDLSKAAPESFLAAGIEILPLAVGVGYYSGAAQGLKLIGYAEAARAVGIGTTKITGDQKAGQLAEFATFIALPTAEFAIKSYLKPPTFRLTSPIEVRETLPYIEQQNKVYGAEEFFGRGVAEKKFLGITFSKEPAILKGTQSVVAQRTDAGAYFVKRLSQSDVFSLTGKKLVSGTPQYTESFELLGTKSNISELAKSEKLVRLTGLEKPSKDVSRYIDNPKRTFFETKTVKEVQVGKDTIELEKSQYIRQPDYSIVNIKVQSSGTPVLAEKFDILSAGKEKITSLVDLGKMQLPKLEGETVYAQDYALRSTVQFGPDVTFPSTVDVFRARSIQTIIEKQSATDAINFLFNGTKTTPDWYTSIAKKAPTPMKPFFTNDAAAGLLKSTGTTAGGIEETIAKGSEIQLLTVAKTVPVIQEKALEIIKLKGASNVGVVQSASAALLGAKVSARTIATASSGAVLTAQRQNVPTRVSAATIPQYKMQQIQMQVSLPQQSLKQVGVLDSRMASLTAVGLKQELKSLTEMKTGTETKQVSSTETKTSQSLKTELKTDIKTGLKTELKGGTGLRFNLQPPEPTRTTLPPGKITGRTATQSPEQNLLAGKGYIVQVKTKKKYETLSPKPMDLKSALNFGAGAVDNSAQKTFKIVPTTKPAEKTYSGYNYEANKNKFKQVQQNVFIEQTPYGIDTSGEIAGITAKGWAAKQMLGTTRKRSKNKSQRKTILEMGFGL